MFSLKITLEPGADGSLRPLFSRQKTLQSLRHISPRFSALRPPLGRPPNRLVFVVMVVVMPAESDSKTTKPNSNAGAVPATITTSVASIATVILSADNNGGGIIDGPTIDIPPTITGATIIGPSRMPVGAVVVCFGATHAD